MTEIKRYEMNHKGLPEPDDKGVWVFHEDHVAIVAELQEQVRALAAERDGSLKAIADIYMAVIGGRPGWSNWQAYLDDIVEEVSTTLREIRAQAIEEFASKQKLTADSSHGDSQRIARGAQCRAEFFASRIRAGEQP